MKVLDIQKICMSPHKDSGDNLRPCCNSAIALSLVVRIIRQHAPIQKPQSPTASQEKSTVRLDQFVLMAAIDTEAISGL